MNRRDALKAFGVFVSVQTVPSAYAQASSGLLAGVRVWPGKEVTRVTIESTQAIKHQFFALRDPSRFVIDLDGTDYHDAVRELLTLMPANNASVSDVRIGRNRPGVTRIVLELKREVIPDVFTLAPVKPYAHRLVFDLRPQLQEDVIGRFLAELDALQREAARAQTPPPSKAQPSNTKVAKTPRVRVIAIDAGHGGEDPGAIGPNGLKEKDVTLAIALKLRDLVNARPNLKAFLTRDEDYFVPLNERVEKARAARADLLISIHADAFTHPDANGASVFALSDRGATSAEARYLAEKENGADRVGGVKQASVEADVLNLKRDISLATKGRSETLGKLAVGAISRVNRMHKKNVEFAGFAVLRSPDVPSILVETAFISNPNEEEKLATDEYQTKVARALSNTAAQFVAKNIG